jgi:hypothetical protein
MADPITITAEQARAAFEGEPAWLPFWRFAEKVCPQATNPAAWQRDRTKPYPFSLSPIMRAMENAIYRDHLLILNHRTNTVRLNLNHGA